MLPPESRDLPRNVRRYPRRFLRWFTEARGLPIVRRAAQLLGGVSGVPGKARRRAVQTLPFD